MNYVHKVEDTGSVFPATRNQSFREQNPFHTQDIFAAVTVGAEWDSVLRARLFRREKGLH